MKLYGTARARYRHSIFPSQAPSAFGAVSCRMKPPVQWVNEPTPSFWLNVDPMMSLHWSVWSLSWIPKPQTYRNSKKNYVCLVEKRKGKEELYIGLGKWIWKHKREIIQCEMISVYNFGEKHGYCGTYMCNIFRAHLMLLIKYLAIQSQGIFW